MNGIGQGQVKGVVKRKVGKVGRGSPSLRERIDDDARIKVIIKKIKWMDRRWMSGGSKYKR